MCAKGHGPYPEVVREPMKDLSGVSGSYFYFRNISYGACMEDLLEVSLGIEDRKLEP